MDIKEKGIEKRENRIGIAKMTKRGTIKKVVLSGFNNIVITMIVRTRKNENNIIKLQILNSNIISYYYIFSIMIFFPEI